jgi:hypothetical protein
MCSNKEKTNIIPVEKTYSFFPGVELRLIGDNQHLPILRESIEVLRRWRTADTSLWGLASNRASTTYTNKQLLTFLGYLCTYVTVFYI